MRRGRSQPLSPIAVGEGFDNEARAKRRASSERTSNRRDPRTGLPFRVKHAVEQRSGLSMDDVRVEYNAAMPGTVGAHAVTRGSRIAVAPGQEQHVAHELWHVAQQKMRRVRADFERNGHAISTNAALEREADAVGEETTRSVGAMPSPDAAPLRSVDASALSPMQRQGSDDDEAEVADDEDSKPRRKTRRTGTAVKTERKGRREVATPESDSPDGAGSIRKLDDRGSKRRSRVLASPAAAPSRGGPSSLAASPSGPSGSSMRDIAISGRRGRRLVRPSMPSATGATAHLTASMSAASPAAMDTSSSPRSPAAPRRSSRPKPPRVLPAATEAAAAAPMRHAAAFRDVGEEKRAASPAPLSLPASSASDSNAAKLMTYAMAPMKPAVVPKFAKRRVARKDGSRLTDLVGVHHVAQEGKISMRHGKRYVGPMSMMGKRAEQIARHTTNLALNRVSVAQKASGGPAPVEIQMTGVGTHILINANNRASSETLLAGIRAAGSLHEYALGDEGRTPAMDQDTERPVRYQSKLRQAADATLHWQGRGARGESSADRRMAASLLEATRSAGVGVFDRRKPDQIKAELDKWKDGTAPRVYVVLHGPADVHDSHAELVQSAFRKEHLADYDRDSTMPYGPKTQCLGCHTKHRVKYPQFGRSSNGPGALFEKASGVQSGEEEEDAIQTVQSMPAHGSVSQNNYLRNSDAPDSDTDDTGKVNYPLPIGFDVPFRQPNPGTREWDLGGGRRFTAAAGDKRATILARLARRKATEERREAKLREAARSKAASPAASSRSNSSSDAVMAPASPAAPAPPRAVRTPPRSSDASSRTARAADRSSRTEQRFTLPASMVSVTAMDSPAPGLAAPPSAPRPDAPARGSRRVERREDSPARPAAKAAAPAPHVPSPPVHTSHAARTGPAAAPLGPTVLPLIPTVGGIPRGRIGLVRAAKTPSIWDQVE